MKTILVIGGGVTGLSTMYYLQKMLQTNRIDAKLILLEAESSLGGKISTHHEGEFIMETGADSIVSRKSNVAAFLEDLDLTEDVVYNATGTSYIHIDGELKPIPEDCIFGIPLSLQSLVESELVSPEGKLEALKDYYTPNEQFTKNDSMGEFLVHFLGKELVERQIEPVMSGVYSGKLDQLTIASTLPYLLEYKNQYGSILKGLSENRTKLKGDGKPKFLSFQNGVSTLIDRFEQRLDGVEIRKGVRATQIQQLETEGYVVTASDDRKIHADYVVLSTHHPVAQKLLDDEQLDLEFDRLKNSSLISVYIGMDVPDEQLPKDGTGFIAADDSDLACNACTWTSRKWSHTSENSRLLVRLFYKSSKPVYETLQRLTEDQLLEVALTDIERSLGISGQPVTYRVTRWHETMPNYHLGHHDIVSNLESLLAETHPGLFVAGCSYYGVGIPDCIANGEHTANKIMTCIHKADLRQY
ncbi:protoporphyrinogen oxidase [Paenibacillus swuensis]|uniref:Coproporphyrinogen III oxidase n=1 Tax=Paenibacillus swuensis TaxID=1178515 RepID=A0A172TLB1_9BACL|nr:protoporphyrinogen oxidase [Paenibacillus swuensis]ANE47704.1 protoporphyrinogen oxidase [Paenibacillus swuensis]